MIKMFLFFSHRLNDEQIQEAKERWSIDIFIYLPQCLQNKWSNINPVEDFIDLSPFIGWIEANAGAKDVFLVQGDFGATFELVTYLKNRNNTVVYSTSERIVKEVVKEDSSIEITHRFKHNRFRLY